MQTASALEDDMKSYIGIDLGGTKIGGILLDKQKKVLASTVVPTNAELGEQEVCLQIFSVVDAMVEQAALWETELDGIGIGVPGAINKEQGMLLYAANLPLQNFPITALLQEKYQLRVVLENDANAAALAEYRFGAGIDSWNMIFVTVSTGIGAGAVLGGRLYRGATGNALELGHITIDKDGPLCDCGNRGCAELYASGCAIVRNAGAEIKRGALTRLKEEGLTARAVFEASAAGDVLARKIVKQSLRDLGAAVSVAAGLFDPDCIVIGGGLAQSGGMLFTEVKMAVKARCLPPVGRNIKIVPAALQEKAGVYGAAALVMPIE